LKLFKKWLFETGREIILRFLQELDNLLFDELKCDGVGFATYTGIKKSIMNQKSILPADSSLPNKRFGKDLLILLYKRKNLVTSLGEIPFRRRQVRKDGRHWILLKEFLKMNSNEQILDEALEESLQGCLFTSFRKAREWGGKLCCLGALWNRFQDLGREVRKREKEAIRFFREGKCVRTARFIPLRWRCQ